METDKKAAKGGAVGQKLGVYRFFLALAVAVSHVGVTVFGLNPGVIAVISFYLLSGFVMTALIERYYLSPDRIGLFYIDRAARLYPQFGFYLAVTLAWVLIARPVSPFLTDITPVKVALNALMVPLGFFMFGLGDALLIPQAWSLGLEAMFYALIPWLVIFRLSRPFAIASAAVFLAAYAGLLDTNFYGYRLLPGTLFIFLAGGAIYHAREKRFPRALLGVWASVAVMLAATWLKPSLHVPYNREVLVGILIGIPAVWALRKQSSAPVDQWLGNLSYGLFLNHFLVVWFMQWLLNRQDLDTGEIVIMLGISTGLSLATFLLIERPALGLRRSLRQGNGSGQPIERTSSVSRQS